jgi:hypothetical protein
VLATVSLRRNSEMSKELNGKRVAILVTDGSSRWS